jgi:asparagine synthase (glutamine-hydrolysing)
MFEHLQGQFAVALWDEKRRRLILARDRFGICPLYWTRQRTADGEWLLFASEIKALLASGLVEARADRRGINQAFTFFAVPGPPTCFEGIRLLQPGHFLRIQLGEPGQTAQVSEHTYWQIDYPDHGQEDWGSDDKKVIDQFEEVLVRAVDERLRADVPVVSYLSGGVDSSTVVALAKKVRGEPIPTFTIQVVDPQLDEASEAGIVSRHTGSRPEVVRFGAEEALSVYPRLIRAAESPVIDTSCGALLLLAQEVHRQGYKVALTGEGADEWMPGYPWYKIHKLLGYADVIPGLNLSQRLRRWYLRVVGTSPSYLAMIPRNQEAAGGHCAWHDLYGMMSRTKAMFYSHSMHEAVDDHVPFEDLGFNVERMKRWHPLNRALCVGARIHLPGLLLNAKGDRVAMHNSVETRYPFLDEDVFKFLAGLHPRWKMRGFKEKYLLRRLAERWLPKEIAWRRKAMFRAPFDSFHIDRLPPFVDQLLSDESLRKADYFDPQAVHYWRQQFRQYRAGSWRRTFIEMGLVGVVATQLWHQTFIDGSLADLPAPADRQPPQLAARNGEAARQAAASPSA